MLTAAVCMRVIGFTGSRDRSLLLFLVAVIIVLEDSYHNVYIFTAAVAAADNGRKYWLVTACRRHLVY